MKINHLSIQDKNSGTWKPTGDAGECGTRTTLTNIVGGNVTKLGDYPYMALLGYDYDSNKQVAPYMDNPHVW